jgi:hypothetical protein
MNFERSFFLSFLASLKLPTDCRLLIACDDCLCCCALSLLLLLLLLLLLPLPRICTNFSSLVVLLLLLLLLAAFCECIVYNAWQSQTRTLLVPSMLCSAAMSSVAVLYA